MFGCSEIPRYVIDTRDPQRTVCDINSAMFKLHYTIHYSVIVWCDPLMNTPCLWHLCYCVVWLWIHIGCGFCAIMWCDTLWVHLLVVAFVLLCGDPLINTPWLWHLCYCVVWRPLLMHLGCGICVIMWCDPLMNTPWLWHLWYCVVWSPYEYTLVVAFVLLCGVTPLINAPWLWHLCYNVMWSTYEYTLVVAFVVLCSVISLWIYLGCGICVIVWCDPLIDTPWLWHLWYCVVWSPYRYTLIVAFVLLCGVIPVCIHLLVVAFLLKTHLFLMCVYWLVGAAIDRYRVGIVIALLLVRICSGACFAINLTS